MVTIGGFILSGSLGLLARRIQVSLIGKTFPFSYQRLVGYGLSSGFFMTSYYFFSGVVDGNRELLDRRLQVLREQRAKVEAFSELTELGDQRATAPAMQGRFFKLLDKYGAPYK
ncbi:hypothetical protein CLIB1444_03S03840 [[Candida] jaroonii]|uniref:Uncharacterized protein n=1 Tax=[Candida] jaroonii TaxID=467808 RepID=A0ACA9Y577_9ASCO|nr:hypothetical protein CLIB1444_03S03840 [[Candida] jaroonii]